MMHFGFGRARTLLGPVLLVPALLIMVIPPPRSLAFSEQARASSEVNEKVYREGRKLIRAGKFKEAIKLYEDLLSLNPEDVEARIGASFAYAKASDYQKGLDHANEAARLDPNRARAHALAGLSLLRSGFVSAATQQLILAFKLDAKEPLAYGAAAEIDYYEGRSRESREKAIYAFSLDPDEPDYLVTIARASSRIELFADAADAYEEFLRIAPRTDTERRERIQGLIQFYRQLAGQQVHQIAGGPTTQVPFRLGTDRRPYVRLRINGRDATFVIDTGSGFTVISKEAARRFGVSEIARGGKSQGIGGDGKFPIVYGLIRWLQLGDIRVKSIPCFIRPFHGNADRPADERAEGFIGLSILAHFLTELDYKDNVMRLDRSADRTIESTDPSTTVIPFRTTQNGLISIETEVDDIHHINTILDSGASTTVLSTAAIDRLKMRDNIIKGQSVRVVGAAGVNENVELIFIRNYRVADLHQKNLRALVLDFAAINQTSGFEQSGILGGDFLRHFRLTIDFNRARLGLQPQTSAVIKN
ncbi:MAG TPA: aspartyl protease family protein [Blastocatellia bacterium]|nr:aspartyl protease family protein [Blastocatellia bacterium]